MKHFLFAAAAYFVLTGAASAQELHLVSPGSVVQSPLSPVALQNRVESAASAYRQYAPVPRFTPYDYACPRDASEFEETVGMGALLVVAFSQQAAELPLSRLYLRQGGKDLELKLISSAASKVGTDTLPSQVFGPNRWEGLYAFPCYLQQAGAQLVADFQINRTGFVLATLPQSGRSQTPDSQKIQINPATAINQALLSFIAREYPGFLKAATDNSNKAAGAGR